MAIYDFHEWKRPLTIGDKWFVFYSIWFCFVFFSFLIYFDDFEGVLYKFSIEHIKKTLVKVKEAGLCLTKINVNWQNDSFALWSKWIAFSRKAARRYGIARSIVVCFVPHVVVYCIRNCEKSLKIESACCISIKLIDCNDKCHRMVPIIWDCFYTGQTNCRI